MEKIILEVDCKDISINEEQSQIVIKISAKLKVKKQNSQQGMQRVLHSELIEDLQQKYYLLFRSKIIKDAPQPSTVVRYAPTEEPFRQIALNTDQIAVQIQKQNVFTRKAGGQVGNQGVANNINLNQNQNTSNQSLIRPTFFFSNNIFTHQRPNQASISHNCGNNVQSNNIFLQSQGAVPGLFSGVGGGSTTQSFRKNRGGGGGQSRRIG